MKIKIIDQEFSICKVNDFSEINLLETFYFVSKTDKELSVVCNTQSVPKNCIKRDDGWKAFRIEGELDFSLIGILANISSILATAKIGIYVVSTFDTDYVLTKEENFNKAIQVLTAHEYQI